MRTALFAWTNLHISRATLTPLEGGVTKVRLSNAAIKHWSPGAHVHLSIPRFGMIQSHPATIMSTPHSHGGDMVFMLKSHKGFTRRIMTSANNSATALLPHTKQETREAQNAEVVRYRAMLNGPYGGSHSDLAAFDSVCLIAGSTGITFTLSVLQDIADRSTLSGKKLPVRRVHFVWCVKETSWTYWCHNELSSAIEKLTSAGIAAEISIYVTCSDVFTEQSADPKECGCACDKSLGRCCCVVVDEDREGLRDSDTIKPTTSDQNATSGNATVTEKTGSLSSGPSQLEIGQQAATRMPHLPCAAFYSGRPEMSEILTRLLDGADGESGVAVCGPIGLNATVRNTVVRLSDRRTIHKGTGAQGCYLHVESYS